MACYHPLKGFKRVGGGISWSPSQSYTDVEVQVPCGQCIGCRLQRSHDWAVRMMHEASMHSESCFITLTYDDEHMPRDGSLVKQEFPKFIRALRKRLKRRISYFHCGEYGEENGRPHYHAVLFGYDFPDRVREFDNHEGDAVFSSPLLTEVWSKGIAMVGELTFASAAYVARYVVKKVTGDAAHWHYMRTSPDGEVYWLEPEFCSMSLKPAIGRKWFEKYGDDVRGYDGVVQAGSLRKSPRYYDKLRGKAEMKPVKFDRLVSSIKHAADHTEERLAVSEEVKKAQLSYLKRSV